MQRARQRIRTAFSGLLGALLSQQGCGHPNGQEYGSDSVGPASDSGSSDATPPEMLLIPASTFEMGCISPLDCAVDSTEHSVTLTHSYYVGVTETTVGQFRSALGYYTPPDLPICEANDDACPADHLTWHESAAYANALSDGAGLQECYVCTGAGSTIECDVSVNPYGCAGYRLLTEAEWEGAARCGTDRMYAGSDIAADVGWVAENSDGSTHLVAGLGANTCGTYDMTGNLWEWVQDWYEAYDTSPSGSVVDPVGPEAGDYGARVMRGGDYSSVGVTVYDRAYGLPAASNYHAGLGFRVGRTVVAR